MWAIKISKIHDDKLHFKLTEHHGDRLFPFSQVASALSLSEMSFSNATVVIFKANTLPRQDEDKRQAAPTAWHVLADSGCPVPDKLPYSRLLFLSNSPDHSYSVMKTLSFATNSGTWKTHIKCRSTQHRNNLHEACSTNCNWIYIWMKEFGKNWRCGSGWCLTHRHKAQGSIPITVKPTTTKAQ